MIVLIAEDMPLMAQLLKNFLSPISREFIFATTLAEAKAIVCSDQHLDLIALDLRFPDATYQETIDAIAELRKCRPEALLVVITGNADPTLEEKAIQAGAHGFMFKPSVSKPNTFMTTLYNLIKSIIRNPTKYTQNQDLAERLLARLRASLPELKDEPAVTD